MPVYERPQSLINALRVRAAFDGRFAKCSLFIFVFMVSTASFMPLVASAQNSTGADPWAGVEEMLVTGSGINSLLAPENASVIAFDTQMLADKGVANVEDIAAFVPNLDIRSQNATNASFFIRGVGLQDFGANSTSAVPIIQDGVIRNPSATQLVGLFDIEGLSVLRGPQSTGNHRNASAGAIKILTAKPTAEFSGYAQTTLSQISSVDAYDAPRYSVEGALSAPLFEDIVSMRISARYSKEFPFVENGCANRIPLADRPAAAFGNDANAQICDTITRLNPQNGDIVGVDGERLRPGDVSAVRPFLKKRLGEVDDYAFRVQLRVQPPDSNLDFILRAEASNLNRDSTVGAHVGTGRFLGGLDTFSYRDAETTLRRDRFIANGLSEDQADDAIARQIFDDRGDRLPYRGNFDTPGRTLVETLTISGTTTATFDTFEMEVNLGYIQYNKSEDRDTDISPNRLFPSVSEDDAWEAYASVDFQGEELLGLPISWTAGGYGIAENVESEQIQTLGFIGLRTVTTDFEQDTYGFGLFADFDYELSERITVSAGARYNWEKKDFEVSDLDLIPIGNFVFPDFAQSDNQLTWDAVTGFARVRYEFTEDIGVFMSYTRGFKAGHFNPSRPDSAQVPGEGFADPEEVDSFEWGADFAGWDDRISGNFALFYYNYRNYQVFRLTSNFGGVFREIQNAERARNLGAELSVTLRPLQGYVPEAIEGLTITFDGGWLDTEYLDFTNLDQRNTPAGNFNINVDNTGNQLISASSLQATLNVTWPLLIDRLGTLTPQYDMTWTDDTPFDPNRGRGQRDIFGDSRFRPYTIGNRAYAIHNVRLTWDPPGESNVRVSGWCRNVADQRFDNFSVDLTNFAQLQLRYPGDPRICGADVRLTW